MTLRIAVIGAGPGGYVAALACARAGVKVTVVEAHRAGGTCLHWGCIPSKILREAADRLEAIGQAGPWGIGPLPAAGIDLTALNRRKARVIETQAQAIEALLKTHPIDLIQGVARIAGSGTLDVDTAKAKISVAWDRLILACGSAPTELPALPFDGRRIISSNEALNLDKVPESVAIVGGGVIGCEFAGIMAGFGARVTLIEALDRLLPLDGMDRQISAVLAREMKKRKIDVRLNTVVAEARILDDGVRLGCATTGTGAPAAEVTAQTVLVCVGRRPATADLGLDTIAVATDARGWVIADAAMATTAPGVYAIGDVLGPSTSMLAHAASAEARVAAANATGDHLTMDYAAIPLAVFTAPPVACVGQTLEQALAAGRDARSDTILVRTTGKAQAMDKLAGQATMVSDKATGRVLGVHLIGAEATELIAEATLAVRLELTVHDVAATVHAHPTMAEVIGEVALKAVEGARGEGGTR